MSYVCEKCGHVDDLCWKGAFSRGMEVSHTRLDELKIYRPDIYRALMNAPLNEKNPIREVVIGCYAYGLWKSNYVRRRWIENWKYQRWKAIPMEKHVPKDAV